MEIVPGIHRIQAPFGDRFVCVYLLNGDEHALLVDTGIDDTPRRHIAPYLDSIGVPPARIRYVLTSHADFDHSAGNASVREMAPQAIFMCHRLDRPMIEDMELIISDRYGEFKTDHGMDESDETKVFIRTNSRTTPVDIALTGDETIRLGADWHVQVLHTPGHSRGHLSVHDPRGNALIICDATLFNAVLRADGSPAFPPTYRYVDTYIASAERFMGMQVDTLLTSHYPVYTGAAVHEFLRESRAYVDRVDDALRAGLAGADAPRTMRELIDALGHELGEWPEAANQALAHPLLGHLERMVQRGMVVTGRRNGLLTYSLKRVAAGRE